MLLTELEGVALEQVADLLSARLGELVEYAQLGAASLSAERRVTRGSVSACDRAVRVDPLAVSRGRQPQIAHPVNHRARRCEQVPQVRVHLSPFHHLQSSIKHVYDIGFDM